MTNGTLGVRGCRSQPNTGNSSLPLVCCNFLDNLKVGRKDVSAKRSQRMLDELISDRWTEAQMPKTMHVPTIVDVMPAKLPIVYGNVVAPDVPIRLMALAFHTSNRQKSKRAVPNHKHPQPSSNRHSTKNSLLPSIHMAQLFRFSF